MSPGHCLGPSHTAHRAAPANQGTARPWRPHSCYGSERTGREEQSTEPADHTSADPLLFPREDAWRVDDADALQHGVGQLGTHEPARTTGIRGEPLPSHCLSRTLVSAACPPSLPGGRGSETWLPSHADAQLQVRLSPKAGPKTCMLRKLSGIPGQPGSYTVTPAVRDTKMSRT